MAPPAGNAKLGSLGTLNTPAKVGIGILLPGLMGLVYWVIFYNDISTKIDQVLRQKQALLSDLAAQQQAQASYFADRDELALRQQKERDFNKVLPSESEVSSFLSAVQQVSNVSGLSLNAWQPHDEAPMQFYARVPMTLHLSGHFHQLVKFAYELSKIDRVINLENISITEPKRNGDETVLSFRCLATAFRGLTKEGR